MHDQSIRSNVELDDASDHAIMDTATNVITGDGTRETSIGNDERCWWYPHFSPIRRTITFPPS